MNVKLQHLSNEEIQTLMERYYSGEKVKTLISEYNLDIKENVLYTLFPPIISEEKCEYCGKSLIAYRKSRSSTRYNDNDFVCPDCGHVPSSKKCNCAGCERKRESEEQRLCHLIKEMYSKSQVPVEFEALAFRDKVFLGAFCELLLCEDMYYAKPYTQRHTKIKLAPTDEFCLKILNQMIRDDVILVSERSPIEAFEEGAKFPSVFNPFRVEYKLNLDFPERKADLFDKIYSPQYYNDSLQNEAYDLWMEIAICECIEYLEYQLSSSGFSFVSGDKTYQTFKTLLADFSVAQIYGIIWKAVAEASKLYLQKNITRKHAANSSIGACIRYAEKAKLNGWKLTEYRRPKELPQSEISAYYFNRVLKIGDHGFTMPPTLIKQNFVEERSIDRKFIHYNLLQPNPGLNQDDYHYFQFICRGCQMRNRGNIWNGFVSSITAEFNRKIDNSYLRLEEEPDNLFDKNAVMVVCCGEFYGTVGYVGREYTLQVKKILNKCTCYRVDLMDEAQVGEKEVTLILTWR